MVGSTEHQINILKYQYKFNILTLIFHWPTCKFLMCPWHSHP